MGLMLDPRQGWEGGGLEVPLSCHTSMWAPHGSGCTRMEAGLLQGALCLHLGEERGATTPLPASLRKGWAGCQQGAAWGQTWAQENAPSHLLQGPRLFLQDREEERLSEPRVFLVGGLTLEGTACPAGVTWQECGRGTVRAEPPPSTIEAPAGRGQAASLPEPDFLAWGMEATSPPPRASRVEVVHDCLLCPLPCSLPGLVSLGEGTGHELSPVLPGVPTPHGPHGEPCQEEGAHTPLRVCGPVCRPHAAAWQVLRGLPESGSVFWARALWSARESKTEPEEANAS